MKTDAMSTLLKGISLATMALHSAVGETIVKRDSYPRARIGWSPPPLPGEIVDDVAVEESQRNALHDMYDATNASASSYFLNWFRPDDDPLHTHYCEYSGVVCDPDLYVTSLDLNETGLSGQIPDSIRSLERLERFKAWMNNHFGLIPSAFGEMEHLEHLILGQNNFVGTIPAELGNARSLRRLLLQSNDLSGTVPSSLCQLSHLRALDLSRNAGLTGTLPSCLSELPELRHVRIRDSKFTGELPLELCALASPFGCDGIACAAGSYQFPYGRQTNSSTPCLPCDTNSSAIGQTQCESHFPKILPSSAPSSLPSMPPSFSPSVPPSVRPTFFPTVSPSLQPSIQASLAPSSTSLSPSSEPSLTEMPSSAPSVSPSMKPTTFEPSFQPSAAPSRDFVATSPLGSTDTPTAFVSDSASLYPWDYPSFEPTADPLSQPSDFVVGGVKQGTFEDDSPERWTWGVLAVILCFAACVLVGLVILARRRRRRHGSQQGDSVSCLADESCSDEIVEAPPSPQPEPVDPFSFPEIQEQTSLYDVDLEDGTVVEYKDASPPIATTHAVPPVDLEGEYEMQITNAGVEFVSAPPPVPLTDTVLTEHESRSPPPQYRSWEEEVRDMPSPIAVRRARFEQKRVTFQEPLEEQYSSDSDKWLLSLRTTASSTESTEAHKLAAVDKKVKPPVGDQVVEPSPFGLRRKWLPVENFDIYK